MINWIEIDDVGIIMTGRIVAVGPAQSAPMKRLLGALPASHLIVLTGGRKRQTAVILDSGHVVLTALSVSEMTALLQRD